MPGFPGKNHREAKTAKARRYEMNGHDMSCPYKGKTAT